MSSGIDVSVGDDGLHLRAAAYVLWLPAGKPYALLADRDGEPWAELFLAPSLHTVEALDDTTRLDSPRLETTPDGHRVVIDAASTAWTAKRVTLDCEPQRLRLSVEVEGSGRLTDVHLLGGHYCGDTRQGSGFFHSGTDFRSVFNPEPWGSDRRVLPAGESTVLDVLGGPVPGKEHWFFTPPPFCLAVSRSAPPESPDDLPAGPWLVMGLGAAVADQRFTALHYDAVEAAFSMRLAYEGHTEVRGGSPPRRCCSSSTHQTPTPASVSTCEACASWAPFPTSDGPRGRRGGPSRSSAAGVRSASSPPPPAASRRTTPPRSATTASSQGSGPAA
jgi:hypothetical protein